VECVSPYKQFKKWVIEEKKLTEKELEKMSISNYKTLMEEWYAENNKSLSTQN